MLTAILHICLLCVQYLQLIRGSIKLGSAFDCATAQRHQGHVRSFGCWTYPVLDARGWVGRGVKIFFHLISTVNGVSLFCSGYILASCQCNVCNDRWPAVPRFLHGAGTPLRRQTIMQVYGVFLRNVMAIQDCCTNLEWPEPMQEGFETDEANDGFRQCSSYLQIEIRLYSAFVV
jgi:hypothetical protein